MERTWVGAQEAAARLGVKPATLYAYVSRGQLRRRRAPDGRRSEYHADDLATLAVRGRRARPVGPSDVVVHTAVTAITGDGPVYRGRPAVVLAGTRSIEEVAALLWDRDEPTPWTARGPLLAASDAALAAVPARASPAARLPLVVAAAALADPLRHDLGPSSVVRAGRELLAVLVHAAGAPAADVPAPLAERLAAGLGSRSAGELAPLVDAALVLLADHELAASTLAARIAASARCDPWAVVGTGLGVLSGPRHGAASRPIEAALADVAGGADPATALAAHTVEDRVPGFGHPLYPDGDPRARRLLALLLDGPLAARCRPLRAVLDAAERDGLPPPNVDAVLAGLTSAAGFPVGTGELLFAVARSVGWLAHALEQYADPQLLRPRAVYTGPPPSE